MTRAKADPRCLANFCPVVGEGGDGRRFALGASGGRKIIGAVLQISSFMLDHGLTLEEAFHQPRIDMSGGGTVTADRTLPPGVTDALAAAFPTTTAVRTNFPYMRSPVRRRCCATANATWAAPRSCRRGGMRWRKTRLRDPGLRRNRDPVAARSEARCGS